MSPNEVFIFALERYVMGKDIISNNKINCKFIIISLLILLAGIIGIYSHFDNKDTNKCLSNYSEAVKTLDRVNSELVYYIAMDRLLSEKHSVIIERLEKQKAAIDGARDTLGNTKPDSKYKSQHADTTELLLKESRLIDNIITAVDNPVESRNNDIFTNINDDVYAVKELAAKIGMPHNSKYAVDHLDNIIEPLYLYINYAELSKILNDSHKLLTQGIAMQNLYSDKINGIKEHIRKHGEILASEANILTGISPNSNYEKLHSATIEYLHKECNLLNQIFLAIDDPEAARNNDSIKKINADIRTMKDLSDSLIIAPSLQDMDYHIKLLEMYINDRNINGADTAFVEKWKKLNRLSYNGNINILVVGGGLNYNAYIDRNSATIKENNPEYLVIGFRMMSGTKDLANDKTSWQDKEIRYELENKDMYAPNIYGELQSLTSGQMVDSFSYDNCLRTAGEMAYYIATGENFRSTTDLSYLLLENDSTGN